MRTEIPGWGVDAKLEDRPGVPMETEPKPVRGAWWKEPEPMGYDAAHLKRAELSHLTPVYGTANPPSGLSGWIKRKAYAIPEDRTTHWMMLLASDRVSFLEWRLKHGRLGFLPLLAAGAGGLFLLNRRKTPSGRVVRRHAAVYH